MNRIELRSPGAGARQQGVRAHNERLILSLIQRQGALTGSDIARLSGLSSQTASVILRQLEQDGLVERGDPQRGRVGKPSVPMALAAEGAWSIGLKIGRRSADLVLTDFLGTPRRELRATYRYPEPDAIFGFLETGLAQLTAGMSPDARARIAGIGIARPLEIWDWHDTIGAPEGALSVWRNIDFDARIARFTDLPVFLDNDATAACRAEHVYGRGGEFSDFAYFFVGSFIGGGIVLNHSVFEGPMGNAGAFGSLPARTPDGRPCQLIDVASIHVLEAAMTHAGQDPARLWHLPLDWSAFEPLVDRWLAQTAAQIAQAALTVCAVIDVEAVLIDGAFPPDIRARLVSGVRAAMAGLDRRGITPFAVEQGRVGGNARALGAACAPVFSRYFLNTHAEP